MCELGRTRSGTAVSNEVRSVPQEVPPRAWLVDLDGTLYSPWPVKLALAAELGLCAAHRLPMLSAFRRTHEELRHELTEPVASPFELQLVRAHERLGVSRDELEAVVRIWMFERPGKWLRMFARRSLLEEIVRFREAGGRTALVSDYPACDKLAALGATDLFDVVIANGEHGGPGRLKPHPDGYQLAAQRLAVTHAECLVIGDREDADGAAAAAAGMRFRVIG